MQGYDAIVIGAGVIGSSVAYHLARFGARNVLVLERLQVRQAAVAAAGGGWGHARHDGRVRQEWFSVFDIFHHSIRIA